MRTRAAIACPINREDVFAKCLAASPDVAAGTLAVATYTGWRNFGAMANLALDECKADWLVIAHQDAYLPAGFANRLTAAIDWIDHNAPAAGVIAAIGRDLDGNLAGQTWSSGLAAVFGRANTSPVLARAIDEVLIVIRVSAGLRFDEALPGFHLYATDLLHTAKAAGWSTWIADLSVVHHSYRVVKLDRQYRAAWRYLRTKWHASLPLDNLVCPVTENPWRLLVHDVRIRLRAGGRLSRPAPRGEPIEIAQRLGWEAPTEALHPVQ